MCKMGCESSRSVKVDEGHRPDYKVSLDKNAYFTELQIDCVRSTWPLVAKDKVTHGCTIFRDIFQVEPKLKNAFSFGSMTEEAMRQHPKFLRHAQKFMETIESVCEQLEEAEDPDSEISRQIVLLGAKHASMSKFDWHFFHVFIKCLHITWEQVLGEEYTEDVRESWAAVFEYIRDKLQDGFNFYIDDKENENAQNGDLSVTITTTAGDSIQQIESQ